MIDARTDNDGALATCFLSRTGKFASQLHHGLSADAREFFLPGRSVGDLFVVVACRVVALKAARHPILGYQEIQARGYRHATVNGLDVADRHTTPERAAPAEIDK